MKFILKLFIFILILFTGRSELFADNNLLSLNKPLSITINSIDVTHVTTCQGDAEGTITINASGGTGVYQYSIDGGVNYQSSNFFNNLTPGAYTVFVKDDYGTDSDICVVNDIAGILITNESYTDVTGCFNDNNGTITMGASGGAGSFTYSIDGGSTFLNNGGNFINLFAGIYDLSVQDGHGCIEDGSQIIINQPNELLITAEDAENIYGCYGNSNGVIDITATGGTAPISYSIDNGATFGSGHYFSGLDVGTYNVLVHDDNGCSVNGSEIILTQPAELIITSENYTDVNTCFGDNSGTITITATGGTGDIQYSTNGGTIFQISGNFTNLYAGDYDVAVKDENFCLASGSTLTIGEPTQLTIISETKTDVIGCFGDNTGQIIIVADGGTPPLSYSIDAGATYQASGTFNGLTYGTYTIKVKDNNGCAKNGGSHLITQPEQLSVYKVDKTDVNTCFNGNNGSITISAMGGTPDLQYSVDNGTTFFPTNSVTGLTAGTYNVLVEDANNCPATYPDPIIISQPTQINIISETPQDPSCFGEPDGEISIIAEGGTGTLHYSINGGTNYYLTNVLTGLSAGVTYNISVQDANACTVSGSSIILTDPSEVVIDNVDVIPVSSCHGGDNGEITITASGGVPVYYYSIDGGVSYTTNNHFTGLTAGTYWIMVKDSHECLKVGSSYTLTQPDALEITNELFTNIEDCNGAAAGTITINAQGGTAPLYYSIDLGTSYFNNSGIFTGLIAGVYSIAVKDDNNCEAYGSTITISEPEVLVPNFVSKEDIKCFGDNDGSITLEATGGQTPYRFSIDGGVTYEFKTYFSNLGPGTYQTYVKDHFDCVQMGEEITILEPTLFEIQDVTFNSIDLCYGDNTGNISISATGGTVDYHYSIDNGNSYSSTSDFNDLTAGFYHVRVFDAHQCEAIWPDVIELTQPPELYISSIESTSIACYGDDNGTITINGLGGTGQITYSIDNGTTYLDNSGTFTNLVQGTYSPQIIDENDCVITDSPIIIYEPTLLEFIGVEPEDESCIGSNDGFITISAQGGTPEYEYSIDGINYQTFNIISGLAPGIYTPYLRDANSCATFSGQVEIGSPESAAPFVADVDTGCSPLVVKFTKLTGGTNYFWDFGEGNTSTSSEPTHTFLNLTLDPVTYQITTYGYSPTGCSDTAYGQITVYPQPDINFKISPDTSYMPDVTVSITNTGQTGYTNYFWDFGDGSFGTDENPISHTYETCGDYPIIFSADNEWCSDSVQQVFNISARQPEAVFDVDNIDGCIPVPINIIDNSYEANTYTWDFGDGASSEEQNPSYIYEIAGEYTVNLRIEGYCGLFDTKDTIITAWEAPAISFETNPDTVLATETPVHCYNYTEGEELSYLWTFGDGGFSDEETPLHYYTEAGDYTITLFVTSKHNCIDSLTSLTTVHVLPMGRIFFPNVFTPNGDGLNDTFGPAVFESIDEYELKIFNRGAEVVFFSEDINYRWDGTFKGSPVIQDVYVWKVEGKYSNGQPFVKVGNVTIMK